MCRLAGWCVTAIDVIFKTPTVCVFWRLTGEQHIRYGVLYIQSLPGKGNLAPVSCLLLGCSRTDRSCHPSEVPGGSHRQAAGSVRFGSTG